jgi:hypothetical protein
MLRKRRDENGKVAYYAIDEMADVSEFVNEIMYVIYELGYKDDMEIKALPGNWNYYRREYYAYFNFVWNRSEAGRSNKYTFCLELSSAASKHKTLIDDIKIFLKTVVELMTRKYHDMKDTVVFRKVYEREYVF